MKKKTQAFRISVFGVKRQNERQVAQCVRCEATDNSLFFVTKFARNFFFDSAEILRAGPIMNAYRVLQLSRFVTCCFPRGFLALLILRVRILWLPLFLVSAVSIYIFNRGGGGRTPCRNFRTTSTKASSQPTAKRCNTPRILETKRKLKNRISNFKNKKYVT